MLKPRRCPKCGYRFQPSVFYQYHCRRKPCIANRRLGYKKNFVAKHGKTIKEYYKKYETPRRHRREYISEPGVYFYKPMKTYGKNRKCPLCKHSISEYNSLKICNLCNVKVKSLEMRNKITTKELHAIRYGLTPDNEIQKIKDKLSNGLPAENT